MQPSNKSSQALSSPQHQDFQTLNMISTRWTLTTQIYTTITKTTAIRMRLSTKTWLSSSSSRRWRTSLKEHPFTQTLKTFMTRSAKQKGKAYSQPSTQAPLRADSTMTILWRPSTQRSTTSTKSWGMTTGSFGRKVWSWLRSSSMSRVSSRRWGSCPLWFMTGMISRDRLTR